MSSRGQKSPPRTPEPEHRRRGQRRLEQIVTAAEADRGAPLDGILHLAGTYAFQLLADSDRPAS
ncbi:hypothetical protein [Streptomyces sp. NPDC053431]|uniref:hypothetical protein n=1 Tax=Streptomyces sp. NPDC053431 TaxID=3365703 RepID=UPI0037D45DEC